MVAPIGGSALRTYEERTLDSSPEVQIVRPEDSRNNSGWRIRSLSLGRYGNTQGFAGPPDTYCTFDGR